MAIQTYSYDYDMMEASVSFEVDREKFTNEMALATLNFFTWDWDDEADPIDEVMKKYAMEAIRVRTHNDYNEYGVKSEFKNKEGFAAIDGSHGITLIEVSGYELDDDKLIRKQ